jgi:hypothetical protein
VRIARNSSDTLLLKEETVWISVVCAIAALFTFVQGAAHGAFLLFLAGALFIVFGLVFLRTVRVELDKRQRTVTIERMKVFRRSTSRLRFEDIDDVVIETRAMSNGRTAVWRLGFVTRSTTVPLTEVYSGRFRRHEGMRTAVLEALAKPVTDAARQSLRYLIKSQRTLDAIVMVRALERIDLASARDRVARMEKEL